MKRRILFAIVLMGIGGIYLFTQKSQVQSLTDLALTNIEALAQGEGGAENYYCINHGDIECNGYKAERKISGFSLK